MPSAREKASFVKSTSASCDEKSVLVAINTAHIDVSIAIAGKRETETPRS